MKRADLQQPGTTAAHSVGGVAESMECSNALCLGEVRFPSPMVWILTETSSVKSVRL